MMSLLEGKRQYTELTEADLVQGRSLALSEGNLAILIADRTEGEYRWEAESGTKAHYLFSDGRLVVTQASGQVCFLRLYQGNQMIKLDGTAAQPLELPGAPAGIQESIK